MEEAWKKILYAMGANIILMNGTTAKPGHVKRVGKAESTGR